MLFLSLLGRASGVSVELGPETKSKADFSTALKFYIECHRYGSLHRTQGKNQNSRPGQLTTEEEVANANKAALDSTNVEAKTAVSKANFHG